MCLKVLSLLELVVMPELGRSLKRKRAVLQPFYFLLPNYVSLTGKRLDRASRRKVR